MIHVKLPHLWPKTLNMDKIGHISVRVKFWNLAANFFKSFTLILKKFHAKIWKIQKRCKPKSNRFYNRFADHFANPNPKSSWITASQLDVCNETYLASSPRSTEEKYPYLSVTYSKLCEILSRGIHFYFNGFTSNCNSCTANERNRILSQWWLTKCIPYFICPRLRCNGQFLI